MTSLPITSVTSPCELDEIPTFLMSLVTERPKYTVHKALVIYDFSSGRWKRGPDLPQLRYEFCCLVDSAKGLIYTAGGFGSDEVSLRTAIVYDIEKEKWEYLTSMIWRGCECHSVFTDDKFSVVSHVEGHIQAYDPNTRQWSAISSSYDRSKQASFAAFGRIYHDFCSEIIKWDYRRNTIRVAGTAIEFSKFIGTTMWHQQILVAGVDMKNVVVFYLFEPSIQPGKEDKWTLISTLSVTQLPTVITTLEL